MYRGILFFVLCSFVAVSESAFIDTIAKCSIKDSECQKNSLQSSLKSIGKTGVPELNIPSIDPVVIENLTVSVQNVVNITIIHGVVKGIKDCVFNKYHVDIEKGTLSQKLTCDLTIKGTYKVASTGQGLKTLLGSDNSLSGEGKTKVKLEKVRMDMKFPIIVVKHDDGETYIKCLFKKTQYDFDVLGQADFYLDNIMLGNENISQLVLDYLNTNFKFVLKTSGKAFMDKAVEFYYDFANKFFDNVPSKYYIIEDLTSYVKED